LVTGVYLAFGIKKEKLHTTMRQFRKVKRK